jgi:serine palmitoyltransferase
MSLSQAGGRGTVEACNVDVNDVAVTVGSLSTSLGSVGGFCVGTRDVVDHQRLAGAGYCFSASAPPFLCATATAALEELVTDPSLVARLAALSRDLHDRILSAELGAALRLISDPCSPVKHLVLVGKRSSVTSASSEVKSARMLSPTTQKIDSVSADEAKARLREERVLDEIVRRCAADEDGVLLSRSHALEGEPFPARPAIRIVLTLRHSAADAQRLVAVLKKVVDATT